MYAQIFVAVHIPFFRNSPTAVDFCVRWLKQRGLTQGCAFWELKKLEFNILRIYSKNSKKITMEPMRKIKQFLKRS